MRLNKKGEGGFMESVMVMMIVIISLTLFLAILPSAFNNDKETDTIPTEFLNDIYVTDSGISCGIDIEETMKSDGFTAFRLVVRIIGIDERYELSSGERSSDNMLYTSGTILVNFGGRTMNAEYELAVWR